MILWGRRSFFENQATFLRDIALGLKHPTMAKSFLLLLCCAFSLQGLLAQDRQTANEQLLVYTGIPQKLDLRKADFGWAIHPNYFIRKTDEDDVQRILYQPAKRDTFQLDLPKLKNHGVDLHAHVGRREPLFREQ
jgi:hypothetical protein